MRWPRAGLLLPRLTTPHVLQWCFLLVIELKVSPQLLQPCFSLSRLVLEDPFLGSSCGVKWWQSTSQHMVGSCVIHEQYTHRAKKPDVDQGVKQEFCGPLSA